MSTIKKILVGVGIFLVVVIIVGAFLVWSNNQPPQLAEPNLQEFYENQDTAIEGEPAIYISHLVLPEDMAIPVYANVAVKPLQ